MNYAKVIGSAIQLFSKKITVTLIDADTKELLEKRKIPVEQLPIAFNKPTVLEINNKNWRILQAEPTLADDFIFRKNLVLYVKDNAEMKNNRQVLFSMPTVCNEQPVVEADSIYNGFTISMGKEEWRQMEFFSIEQWTEQEESIRIIENIINSQPNALLGYDQQYRRKEKAPGVSLNIPWNFFYDILSGPQLGNIFYKDCGLIQNGYAIRTESHTYYGILQGEYIQTICLDQYDGMDDELMKILESFKLVLVDWCNTCSYSSEDTIT